MMELFSGNENLQRHFFHAQVYLEQSQTYDGKKMLAAFLQNLYQVLDSIVNATLHKTKKEVSNEGKSFVSWLNIWLLDCIKDTDQPIDFNKMGGKC